MQPTADWWNVALEDIRAAKEERRDAWHRLIHHLTYRGSELDRLKRVAMANLPADVVNFDALVSKYTAQFGRRYIERGAEGWVPDLIKPDEYLAFRGIPASSVAAAFADRTCVAVPTTRVQRLRGRPVSGAFRCWVGLLAEVWMDLSFYPAVTHNDEQFGEFHEFVERWVEWVSRFEPAEIWWPRTKKARGNMIDAVFKELRGTRRSVRGGPFAGYQEIKIGGWHRRSARETRAIGNDCPDCRLLGIDRCARIQRAKMPKTLSISVEPNLSPWTAPETLT